jgi:hypothetical protein
MRFRTKKKLKLGKVIVDYDKSEFSLQGQDWDVHWQLNVVTAIFIRDSLRIFLRHTPALPKTANKPLDEMENELTDKKAKGEISEEESDESYYSYKAKLFSDWKNAVSDVADAFDKYILLNNALYNSDTIRPKEESDALYSDLVASGKLAFDKLKEIYDDLEW